MLKLPRQMLPALLLLIASSAILAACETRTQTALTEETAAQPIPSDFCATFPDIKFDRLHDTRPTIAGAKIFNQKRDAICKPSAALAYPLALLA